MAECKTCGYQLNDKDTVCPMCGAAVEKAPVQQPVSGGVTLCPACGCPVEEGDTVCSLCGKELRPAAKAPEAHPVQQPVNRRRCPMCGKETDASAQFCPSCGKQMAQHAAAPAAKPAAAEQKSGWVYLLGAFGLFFLLWLITNNI